MNPDLKRARENSVIDVAALRDYLHDGNQHWRRHESIAQIMSSDPVFDKSKRLFMTRTQLFERVLSMMNHISELQEKHGWTDEDTRHAISLLDDGAPIDLHLAAFEPVIKSQGSETLLATYGPLIQHRGILGCYLQTELGHGSNVSALETTATFIPQTQEFEINSPTLTSTKWWIGSLGKTATHGVVQAKLILPGGKDVGPHLFFVQLRSLDDHTLLPGRKIGDIGPKAMGGWANQDHGFAQFDHVRVPKGHMLSKFAQVTPEGKYVQPPHAKISYGGMLYIRSQMVTTAGWVLAKAATISIRYAHVRRQGSKSADGLEKQVISYQSVHYRLVPILARAYVFLQLGRQLSKAFASTSAKLAAGDTSTLAEMHATTSGLKVLSTTITTRDVEVARRSMGGHGFSAFSGLGWLYAQYLPAATYEGDNFVLDHQVVRAALKALHSVRSSTASSSSPAQLSPSSAYLRCLLPSNTTSPPSPTSPSDWSDPAVLASLLEWRAAFVVRSHADGALDAGASRRVSNAVTEAFVGAQILEMIRGLKEVKLPAATKAVVARLYSLYLLVAVEEGLADLLSFGLVAPASPSDGDFKDPAHHLRHAIATSCLNILPETIALGDAFGFSDWELDSVLGVYDGKVYEAFWERVQDEPLNQTEVVPGYEEYIRPMLKRGQKLAEGKGAKL